jgi:hypothetical protein
MLNSDSGDEFMSSLLSLGGRFWDGYVIDLIAFLEIGDLIGFRVDFGP